MDRSKKAFAEANAPTGTPKDQWARTRLSLAVSAAVATAAPVAAQEVEQAQNTGRLETVVVTATKRVESAQDVSIALQAVTGDTLREIGAETFDEYVEYLPNVVSAGNGPGKKEIYIRGSATEQTSVTISSAQGSAPGVALYVDEQPVSFGGRNLDVFAADLERIEVLAGPQGTLFGASSQSGNLRLITRKPDPTGFSAGFKARYSATSGGADSGGADAYANLPLGDSLAARIVVYSDNQGGWVDNIPATFTPSGEVVDRNNVAGYGPLLTGADSVQTARNDALVQDDWNDASYRGARIGLSYDISNNWEALVQHTAQTLETEGSFVVDTSLDQPHASARFSPEYNRDEFGLTTWTLTGRMGALDAIYTGGHLSREVDAVIDYTHYNNGGGYITYYLCSGNIYDSSDVNNCYDPTKQYTEDTANTRTTHEFRITTDAAKRLHGIAGVYLNSAESTHIGDFGYASTNDAFAEHISSYNNDNSGAGFLLGNTTLPTEGVNAVGPRPALTTFFNDFTRHVDELAFFGEVAFDVSDTLGVSLSARRYELTSQLTGASNFSFGCRYGIGGNAQRTADGRCNGTDFSNDVTLRLRTLGMYKDSGDDAVILNARSPAGGRELFRGGGSNQATLDAIKNGYLNLEGLQADGALEETDTIVKASINWQPNDDMLFFLTYSEGYRPATQNRNAGQLSTRQVGVFENYVVPAMAVTDDLRSYEIGVKGDFPASYLRLNATLYRNEITNLQLSRFDPSNVAFLFFVENVGDAEATGFDLDMQWAPTVSLTISSAFSVLNTELTRLNPQLNGIAVPVGAELPLAPKFSGNVRARYDFVMDSLDMDAYFALSVNHRGKMLSGLIGSAEFMDDTLFRQSGAYSGLKLNHEGGTFGTVAIPEGRIGTVRRLPSNSRFVNPPATTVNASFGIARDDWTAELYFENLTDEEAQVMQIAGHYTPVVTVQRPRTVGLRLSYDYR